MDQPIIRIFIVSDRQELTERLLTILIAQPDCAIAGLVRDLEGALKQVQRAAPDIVLVSESLARAPEPLRRLSALAPDAALIAICPRGDGAAQQALRAGARAFVSEPFSDEELCAAIRQVYALEAQRRAQLGSAPTAGAADGRARTGGQVLAVLSPKGGVGRSTIAVNLALALRQQTGKEVILIEGRQALGDLDTMLNLVPTSTLADLGPDASDADMALFEALLLRHTSGLRVLLAPHQLNDGKAPDADGFDRILRLARGAADFVVIDGGPLTDPYTTVILQHADRVLLVTVPEMPALQRTAMFVDSARGHGYPIERLRVVVNRATARGGITQQHLQERLRLGDPFMIPDDVSLVTYSVNQGIPLVLSHPRSPVAQSVALLAQEVQGRGERGATAQPGEGIRTISGRLRGLLGIF